MCITLTEKCFAEFKKLTRELTGITIADGRNLMLESRLRKRVIALNLGDYESYLELVKKDRSEQTQFVNLVTTNETYFFRTPRVWDYIENRLIPSRFATGPKNTFTIWSAAASSGDEAHSLGVICQNFKEKNPSFNYRIVGTDISTEMVERCKRGSYSGRTIEAFKKSRPDLFERYMRKAEGENFKAVSEINARLSFKQHNLLQPFPGTDRFDLVLLRNVLIYFKAEEQKRVLDQVSKQMSHDGLLVIGESESLAHLQTAFKYIEPLIYGVETAVSSLPKVG